MRVGEDGGDVSVEYVQSLGARVPLPVGLAVVIGAVPEFPAESLLFPSQKFRQQ